MTELNTRNEFISFFLKHPKYFLSVVSSNYPLSFSQLDKYKSVLNWDGVSGNKSIGWNAEIISKFQDNIDWRSLTTNSSAFNDRQLLETFDSRIDWKGDDRYWGGSIAANKGIYWDVETIAKYADKINFDYLSISTNVDWSETLLDKYSERWDYSELAHNESIPWTLSMFEKYFDESYFRYDGVQTNKSLVSFELVEKYNHLMDWHYISLNPNLPWIEKDLLNYWSDRIEWTGIACNTFLFKNDKDFLEKHHEKWQPIINRLWHFFSANESFPWTKQMIEVYKDYLDWYSLCSNEGIVWDSNLIDHFSDFVEWGGLTPCEDIDENGNVISPYGGWRLEPGLIDNSSIPWSLKFLQRYEEYLDFETMKRSSSIWDKAFKPYIDDEMIDIIMSII